MTGAHTERDEDGEERKEGKAQVDAEAADLVAALNAAYDLREHRARLRSKRSRTLVAEALGHEPSGH